MKVLFLVLTSLLALASGQGDGAECECGLFVTIHDCEIMAHRLLPFDIDNCQAVEECKTKCAEEYRQYTNNGDVNHMLDNGYTVGQQLCLELWINHDSDSWYETVYGYARHCNGPWDYDGEFSINRLCCRSGISYDCDAVTGTY